MLIYLPLLVLVLACNGCATLPKEKQTTSVVISTGPGPEDMVYDNRDERIIISCSERREGQPYYGEIETYSPANAKYDRLQRIGEPSGLGFHPHGIDLVQVKDSLILLVVNHENDKGIHSILRYFLKNDTLYFLAKVTHPLISSPNAVTGLPDGSMLISNDAKKHGSIAEMLFRQKKCAIVYWDRVTCNIASEGYSFTNGIVYRDGKVYLVSTMQNKVWQFDFSNGKLINREVIADIKGGDNIRFDGDNLLVPAHLRFMAFIRHMKKPEVPSPTTVYQINPTTRQTEVVYFDSGEKLSAGSTALRVGDKLYVSGVFNPGIAVIEKR